MEWGDRVEFVFPITTNPFITITLDEALDPNDGQVDYEFELQYFGAAIGQVSDRVNVIIHEIGKFTIWSIHKYYS